MSKLENLQDFENFCDDWSDKKHPNDNCSDPTCDSDPWISPWSSPWFDPSCDDPWCDPSCDPDCNLGCDPSDEDCGEEE